MQAENPEVLCFHLKVGKESLSTSKDTSGSSHYSVCSGDVTKTQQRDMSRSCANTTIRASKESNIHTRHAMQDLIKANNELWAAPV
nr:hypothetical protein [Tanacetum cinerariifolium]